MAKVFPVKTIMAPLDAPSWFVKFLDELNPWLNDVSQALQGKLSLIDNIQAFIANAQIQTLAASATFRPVTAKIPGFKPQVVLLVKVLDSQNNPVEAGPINFTPVDGGVKITSLGGLAIASKYTITLLALG